MTQCRSVLLRPTVPPLSLNMSRPLRRHCWSAGLPDYPRSKSCSRSISDSLNSWIAGSQPSHGFSMAFCGSLASRRLLDKDSASCGDIISFRLFHPKGNKAGLVRRLLRRMTIKPAQGGPQRHVPTQSSLP